MDMDKVGVNGLGEIQGLGVQIDTACARIVTLQKAIELLGKID